MKTLIAAVLLAPALSFGADVVTQIVSVHGDPLEIRNLMQGADVRVDGSRSLGAVVIKGNADQVAKAAQTAKDLDSLSGGEQTRNIEFTVSVIAGTSAPVPGTHAPSEHFAGVMKQLRTLFPFSDYSVLDTSILRVRQGSEGVLRGVLRSVANGMPGTYDLRFAAATAGDQSIHITNLQYMATVGVKGMPDVSVKAENGTVSTKESFPDSISVKTDVDIRESQNAVIASPSLDDLNATIFIVVSARLVP